MEHEIFKRKLVGRVGPHRRSRHYMEQIEARAKRLEDACKEPDAPTKNKQQTIFSVIK